MTRRDGQPDASLPVRCPFCASEAIKTTEKGGASAYWRCEACGELWHPGRHADSLRPWSRAY